MEGKTITCLPWYEIENISIAMIVIYVYTYTHNVLPSNAKQYMYTLYASLSQQHRNFIWFNVPDRFSN